MAYNQPPVRASTDPVISADWNSYVKDNFIEVEARKESDYVEVNASVTISATTAASATTIITGTTFTPDGNTKYKIEFGIEDVTLTGNAAGNACIFHLYDGATNLGRVAVLSSAGTTTLDAPVVNSREFTPSNASHTFSIRAHRTNANCTAVAGVGGADVAFPIWLRTTRMP